MSLSHQAAIDILPSDHGDVAMNASQVDHHARQSLLTTLFLLTFGIAAGGVTITWIAFLCWFLADFIADLF